MLLSVGPVWNEVLIHCKIDACFNVDVNTSTDRGSDQHGMVHLVLLTEVGVLHTDIERKMMDPRVENELIKGGNSEHS